MCSSQINDRICEGKACGDISGLDLKRRRKASSHEEANASSNGTWKGQQTQ